MQRTERWTRRIGWAVLFTALAMPVSAQQTASRRQVDFVAEVLPLLERHCFECHRGADASSGHRLDLLAELLGQNDGEPLVIPKRSDQSVLLQRVLDKDPNKRMPPADEGRPLNEREVAILRDWIDQGVAWDAQRLPPIDSRSEHWSFQSIRRPPVPQVTHQEWCLNPIDSFVMQRFERDGIQPTADADSRMLLRRVHFTLTGLPPSPEEVESFVNAKRKAESGKQVESAENNTPSAVGLPPSSFRQTVDRLLTSPAYAERWARHWLDLARWAESEGYESNHPRPFAWRYRDYVVNAFLHDKPYDQFVREQIAGDELTPYGDEQLIATGFLAAARLSSNEEDKLLQVNDVLVDTVNAVGGVMLGLTIGCAQCHNHKLEPLTQRDYYQLQGFFIQGRPNNLALVDDPALAEYQRLKPHEYDELVAEKDRIFQTTRERIVAQRRSKLSADFQAALAKLAAERTPEEQRQAQLADAQLQFTREGVEKRFDEHERARYQELLKRIGEIEKQLPPRPQTWGFYSPITAARPIDVLPMKGFYPPPYEPALLREAAPVLMVRGDVHRPGPKLDVTWPAVLGREPRDARQPASRKQLADWLTSRDQPLLARVWVNRLWQYHFGRGIVSTPSDFGLAGARPTHPELLDWLASELINSGWSTRHVQRLIVTSHTYRLATPPAGEMVDWHEVDVTRRAWRPRRLEAEAIRDTMLSVTGELESQLGGASVPADQEATSKRRSLYLTQKREEMPRMLSLFDGAEANESCPAREVSTVALQPLYLLNSPFMNERARALTQRVMAQSEQDLERQIRQTFLFALQRQPDVTELEAARAYLSHADGSAENRLAALCLVLLNLNEFVYIE